MKFIDLTGKVFGRLTVLERAGLLRTHILWKCRCSCGNEKLVTGFRLNHGATKSCGCLKRRITSQEKAVIKLLRDYKGSARIRNHSWKISDDFFFDIIKKPCAYCGVEPEQRKSNKRGDNFCFYNGIDRVDNKIGYTIDNCVPCCSKCNYAKQRMSIEDFNLWCERVMKHRMKHVCRSATHFGPLVITSPPISASHFGK